MTLPLEPAGPEQRAVVTSARRGRALATPPCARLVPRALPALVVLLAALSGTLPRDAAAAAPPASQPAAGGVGAVARGGWTWPLAGVPEVVGSFERPEHRWSPGHRGVDLAAAPGTAVLAPTSGVVVFAGRVVDRDVLSIEAPDGLRATLEPVTSTAHAGDLVLAGAAVGEVAAAGPGHCAPRSCLHWGVREGRDTYLDPLLVLLAGGRPGAPALLTPTSAGRG